MQVQILQKEVTPHHIGLTTEESNYRVNPPIREKADVKAIIEGGRDYEVTVDFDKAGTKKMFASFAKLKKI